MSLDERLVLTEDQVRRLKNEAATSPEWRVVVGLMVDEGLRVGEVFDLHVRDVDWENGALRRPRVMEISDELLEYLRELAGSPDRDDLVFDRKWNHPVARQEWRELTQRAGVEGTRLVALRSTGLARMFEDYAASGVARPALDAALRQRSGEAGVPFNK